MKYKTKTGKNICKCVCELAHKIRKINIKTASLDVVWPSDTTMMIIIEDKNIYIECKSLCNIYGNILQKHMLFGF